jgi:hypothetical protein
MTPEERQLLSTLAQRVKSTPAQQRDAEADQLLRDLVQQRPDTVYILAQTVLMQDFALRNAQAQIDDLQRQLSEAAPPSRGQGSFLPGGMTSAGPSGSVPRVNPWSQPGSRDYPPPPPPPGYGEQPGYGGPVMQPSQTSGFLRSAATTAAGVAGGALLFQGISSLFSGHHGGFLGGGGLSGLTPADSLTETTVVNNYYDDNGGLAGGERTAAYDAGQGDPGYQDADYDMDDGGDFGDDGGDYA